MASKHAVHTQQALPASYELRGRLDLSQQQLVMFGVNMVALLLAGILVLIFLLLAFLIRGPEAPQHLTLTATSDHLIVFIVEVLGLSIFAIVLHELLHAIGFWFFTGARPTVGFKGLYAYTGAPDWYLPRNQHLVVLLLPFTVVSVVGVILMVVVPASLLGELIFVLVINGAGALGDLVTAIWLLNQPASVYVNDYGDGVAVFGLGPREEVS